MTTDPTERVAGKILRALGEVKAYIEDGVPMRVHIPGVKPELMTLKDQVLLEDIKFRDQWRFHDWKATGKALEIGRRMRPDWVWSFYHLDPIEGDPERKRWVLTAHKPPTG